MGHDLSRSIIVNKNEDGLFEKPLNFDLETARPVTPEEITLAQKPPEPKPAVKPEWNLVDNDTSKSLMITELEDEWKDQPVLRAYTPEMEAQAQAFRETEFGREFIRGAEERQKQRRLREDIESVKKWPFAKLEMFAYGYIPFTAKEDMLSGQFEAFPIARIAGEFAALATFMVASSSLQGYFRALPLIRRLNALGKVGRFGARAISKAGHFMIAGGTKEIYQQAALLTNKDTTVPEAAKEIAQTMAVMGALAPAAAVAQPAARAAAISTTGFTLAKIQGASNEQATIQAALMLGLSLIDRSNYNVVERQQAYRYYLNQFNEQQLQKQVISLEQSAKQVKGVLSKFGSQKALVAEITRLRDAGRIVNISNAEVKTTASKINSIWAKQITQGKVAKVPVRLMTPEEILGANVRGEIIEGAIKFEAKPTIKVAKDLPNVGQTVSFKNPQGVLKTGRILNITNSRVAIDMAGKQIITTLDQIFPAAPLAGGMMHIPEPAPIFYSKLTGAIAEKMPERATPDVIRGILKGVGISKEEIEWSGLDEFLKGKERVSKTELLEYLAANQLTITETWKGEEQVKIDKEGLSQDMFGKPIKDLTAEEKRDLTTEWNIQSTQIEAEGREGPKFAQYTLAGGENYQELLLRVPVPPSELSPQEIDRLNRRAAKINEIYSEGEVSEKEADRLLAELKEIRKKVSTAGLPTDVTQFISPHFEEPNVIANIRMTDRTTPEGKKVLFVEEIQSDWAAAGRARGFEKKEGRLPPGFEVRRITAEEVKIFGGATTEGKWGVFDESNELMGSAPEGLTHGQALSVFIEQAQETGVKLEDIGGEGTGVPFHPALKKWHEIALKRVLRHAAEQGYDVVSWTTGEQQAQRYDLSKQISKIELRRIGTGIAAPHPGKFEFGTLVAYDKSGKEVISQYISEPSELSNVIGKEPARKLLEAKEVKGSFAGLGTQTRIIAGQDLKVGGEWAKNLYDRMIPQFLKEYGKKFGAKIGTVGIQLPLVIKGQIPTAGRGAFPGVQPAIEITPQMKQALIQEGQPVIGKIPAEVGKPGLEPTRQIFRMSESVIVVSTKGELITLPKGEEYRVLPVYDSKGNIVPGKVILQDGKKVTVFTGELRKLAGQLLAPGEAPFAGGLPAERPTEVPEEKPVPRKEQRKTDMELWATPDIMSKLLISEKDFLEKYIKEGKTLEQIAKETGEHIDDIKKQELWTYAHMQEALEETYAERVIDTEAGLEEFLRLKTELKDYLGAKLDPKLKKEEEYHNLTMLPWLWAEEGRGVRPDEFADELAGLGYPIEHTEQDVLGLIEEYFREEIQGRAAKIAGQFDKEFDRKERAKTRQLAKQTRTKRTKAEREISGVGNGSVISRKEDLDFTKRAKIFKGMPFALLGNKAEVLARLCRLTDKFKTRVRQDVKKVYDLWGGAKGYRSGLFPDLPASSYNLNELSDERNNYYKNVQDPKKNAAMKKALDKIMVEFTDVMQEAFGLPAAKTDADFLEMLNSWLKMGLRKERYYFAKEVIQDFGDRLLAEAQADKFVSPESSAKYFFLENTSLFGLSPEGWTQGIVRTTKGDSTIRDVLNKLSGLQDKLDSELKRDKGLPITKEDAWTAMQKLTADINAGKVKPKETVVFVDPQYLSPSGNQGTYTVGQEDITWEGHKKNLDQYFLPLVKTGVKIIYTNNADQQLINWIKAHKLPYNIETAIGAVAERRGRDEVISFIGFDFGPEWTVGRVLPGGEKAVKPGQRYVAPRVTGQSAKFAEWLEKRKIVEEQELKKQQLISDIEQIRQSKALSRITVSRVRKYLGVRELKNSGVEAIQKVVDYLEGLKKGDKLLSERQITTLESLFGKVEDIAILPKRIAIDRFGTEEGLLKGLLISKFPLEIAPTVDIKQGHPEVTKIVNAASDLITHANQEVRRRVNAFDELIRKAQIARAKKLTAKERLKRKLVKQDKEIFMVLSGQRVDLTKEEVAVVAYLKNFFKMVREKLELKKIRKHYVTHLEQPFMEKIMERGIIGAFQQYFQEQDLKKELPVNIILELDNIIGSEKFFRFALERKGGITPTTNVQKILHDYSMIFEMKVALDQVLPEGQTIARLLLEGKDALWMKKFLQNLKGRSMDTEFRKGRAAWLARTADALIDIGYIRLLALNKWSPIKNLAAGEANALVWQGFSTYITGKKRFISNPKKAYKLAIEHGILEGTYADYAQRGIGKLKKLQDLGLIGQRAGEVEIRTSMMLAEMTEAEWIAGKIVPENIRKIKDNIAITQGVFSKTESPLWVQTVLGRMIMQMNRWRITDFFLFRRIVNDVRREFKKGNYKGPHVDRFVRMIAIWAIAMYAAHQLRMAGYKKLSQVVQSMGEIINGTMALFTQGDLKRMITDNPTLSTIKEVLFSIQDITRTMHVPGAEKPRELEFQQGIEDTYVVPFETIQDILEEFE